MNKTTRNTASETFEQMTRDERWLGWGYLGGRDRALDGSDPEAPAQPDLVAEVDRRIMEATAGWTYEERFAWANSKDGRWLADVAFGGRIEKDWPMALTYLRRQV